MLTSPKTRKLGPISGQQQMLFQEANKLFRDILDIDQNYHLAEKAK